MTPADDAPTKSRAKKWKWMIASVAVPVLVAIFNSTNGSSGGEHPTISNNSHDVRQNSLVAVNVQSVPPPTIAPQIAGDQDETALKSIERIARINGEAKQELEQSRNDAQRWRDEAANWKFAYYSQVAPITSTLLVDVAKITKYKFSHAQFIERWKPYESSDLVQRVITEVLVNSDWVTDNGATIAITLEGERLLKRYQKWPEEADTPLAASMNITSPLWCQNLAPDAGAPEHLVCNNALLAQKDVELAKLYKQWLDLTKQSEATKASERAWLKNQRDTCRDVPCLEDSYSRRMSEIQEQIASIEKS